MICKSAIEGKRTICTPPDISHLQALIKDPVRADLLGALMSGKAYTANELARYAGITVEEAIAHLGKLDSAHLLTHRSQGPHRYFALGNDEIISELKTIPELDAGPNQICIVTGPKDPAQRKARVCYNHLAGEFGIRMFQSMLARQYLSRSGDAIALTAPGCNFIEEIGIDIDALGKMKRPMCKPCLDWSHRRTHLAGTLGTALLNHVYNRGWGRRLDGSRTVRFSERGAQQFALAFPL